MFCLTQALYSSDHYKHYNEIEQINTSILQNIEDNYVTTIMQIIKMRHEEPIIIIFHGSDRCQARYESGLTFA